MMLSNFHMLCVNNSSVQKIVMRFLLGTSSRYIIHILPTFKDVSVNIKNMFLNNFVSVLSYDTLTLKIFPNNVCVESSYFA